MIATWTLVVGIIAAVASLIAAVAAVTVTLLSLQEKRRKELPRITLYRAGKGRDFYCSPNSDNPNIGWKILKVNVKQSEFSLSAPIINTLDGREPRKCLRQPLLHREEENSLTLDFYSEWRDFCEWPSQGDSYPMEFHDDCGKALLSFTCEAPSSPWWNLWRKRVTVPYLYEKGSQHLTVSELPEFKNR